MILQSEDINLDPKLKASCSDDIRTYCSDMQAGKGAILNCLQKRGKDLSQTCQDLVLKRGVNIDLISIFL